MFLKTEEFDKKCHSIVMILREKKLSWEGCLHFVAKYYSITSFEGGGSGQYITVYYIGGGGSRKGPKKYYVIFAQPL